jgi:hypothetical protein
VVYSIRMGLGGPKKIFASIVITLLARNDVV